MVSVWSDGSAARHRSSSSLTVTGRLPIRAATSDGLCAGADEHARKVATSARKTARFIKISTRYPGPLATGPTHAQADVDESRRRNGRRLQLDPVLLVEHVLHGHEDVEVPAKGP